MLKNYVLGAEVAKKGKFHIANISMLLKDFGLIEGIDYLKFGGITLLNKQSLRCPKYIYKLMWDKSMTDMSDLVPLTFFKETLENNTKLIEKEFKILKIEGKQFVNITGVELRSVFMNESVVKSVVDNDEIPDLVNDNYIDGYIKLSNKKSLCWY
jgi:hypothetical protein